MRKVQHILDNIVFDSSWELAYYIYLRDYGIPFEYHPDIEIPYKLEEDDEKFHIFHPDFKVHDKLIEIKGTHLAEGLNEKEIAKIELMDKLGIDVITGNDIKPFLQYVEKTYGKGFLDQCRKSV